MRFLALACDYDGTLATNGVVPEETMAGLERVLASGRKLILVTGRELDEWLGIFPHPEIFEWIVAENGALLYQPRSREIKLLSEPPPANFVARLRERGVERISVGKVIVATWEPYEAEVLAAIRDLGLELQVIFNKGAVMVLPAGVNKAFGLSAALKELRLSPHNVVAVGDAENDHALLALSECSVAVANALPAVKDRVDFVTQADHGQGVLELIDALVESDLHVWETRLARHDLVLGTRDDETPVHIAASGAKLLIAGPSGSGKSTVATAFLERLTEAKYQFCVIDPEGDYEDLEGAVSLGSHKQGPTVDEVIKLLEDPDQNLVVNLIGLPIVDRPPFFLALLPRLQELRSHTARPHWLIIDEAHHLLPASWEPAKAALPQGLERFVLITVHPQQVAAGIIQAIDTVVAVGKEPESTLQEFCDACGEHPPEIAGDADEERDVVFWRRGMKDAQYRFQIQPAHGERHRHIRKYAEGELPPEHSFYFRGPEEKFNLRAQNLIAFLQLAEGVDEELWQHHLARGDYARWFREAIKDDELAAEAERVQQLPDVTAAESREMIKAAIEARYTLPASGPMPMPGTDATGVRK